MKFSALVVCLGILVCDVLAQMPIDRRNLYERVYAVVPLIGSGTFEDPKRPLHAPVLTSRSPNQRTGIIAYSFQESDDGKFALVEFVAFDRSAFAALFAETRADIKTFERGRARKADVELEFRKFKKDFDFNRFGVRMP